MRPLPASQPQTGPRSVQMAPLSIRAAVESVDEEARTVDLVFSTGAAVERMDFWTGKRYIETLSLEAEHVRLDRLNNGGPLLDAHGAWSVSDQLGAVVPGSVSLVKKEARARVQFSRRATVEEIWQDVRDGLIRSVSVGYRVYKFEETEGKGNALPVRRAVDWEPFEISMVPIPADAGAKVRDGKSDEANTCEIVPTGYVARAVETREMPHDSNMPKVGDQIKVVRPHEPAHDGMTGIVRQAISGALGIEFDDMPGEIHQWYLPTEVVVTKAMPMAPADRSAVPPKTKTKETKPMEDNRSETIVEPRPQGAPAASAVEAEPSERDTGIAAERERCQLITRACVRNRLPQSFADKLISEGLALVVAQTRILEELGKRDDPNGAPNPGSVARVAIAGDDPFVHVRAGIANALLHRVASDRHELEDVGRPYRGMSILDIGKVFLGSRGVRVTSMSKSDLVDALMARAGMHTTSDFPSLLEDVAKKNLRSAYEAAPQTWLPIAQPINLSDFKASRQLQIGDAPGLDEILEHGEYTDGTITEAKETVQLKTYGKIFGITRQALINDDLNAFGQVPALFGRKARDKESDLAWAQITANGLMGDGVALFDASTHANYTASGTAISVDSLGVGRAALRKQKGIDAVTPLNLSPAFLIVPAAKETIADQYVTQITPAASSNVNPFGPSGRTPLTVIVESRLDANSTASWYLACERAQAPVLYYGTLDGQSGPDLRQEEGFGIDGMKFRCRLDVVFKAADWHAIYKNVGA